MVRLNLLSGFSGELRNVIVTFKRHFGLINFSARETLDALLSLILWFHFSCWVFCSRSFYRQQNDTSSQKNSVFRAMCATYKYLLQLFYFFFFCGQLTLSIYLSKVGTSRLMMINDNEAIIRIELYTVLLLFAVLILTQSISPSTPRHLVPHPVMKL